MLIRSEPYPISSAPLSSGKLALFPFLVCTSIKHMAQLRDGRPRLHDTKNGAAMATYNSPEFEFQLIPVM